MDKQRSIATINDNIDRNDGHLTDEFTHSGRTYKLCSLPSTTDHGNTETDTTRNIIRRLPMWPPSPEAVHCATTLTGSDPRQNTGSDPVTKPIALPFSGSVVVSTPSVKPLSVIVRHS